LIQPICNPETLECNYYCDEGYNAYVNEDKTEVYCTKLTGYQKKMIDKLVEDAALKAAYEAEKAAKEQAKVDKAAKKAAAKERIKSCNDQICKDLVDILEL
jgi:hypothetical protein